MCNQTQAHAAAVQGIEFLLFRRDGRRVKRSSVIRKRNTKLSVLFDAAERQVYGARIIDDIRQRFITGQQHSAGLRRIPRQGEDGFPHGAGIGFVIIRRGRHGTGQNENDRKAQDDPTPD